MFDHLRKNSFPMLFTNGILENRTIESRNFQNYWRPPLNGLEFLQRLSTLLPMFTSVIKKQNVETKIVSFL